MTDGNRGGVRGATIAFPSKSEGQAPVEVAQHAKTQAVCAVRRMGALGAARCLRGVAPRRAAQRPHRPAAATALCPLAPGLQLADLRGEDGADSEAFQGQRTFPQPETD